MHAITYGELYVSTPFDVESIRALSFNISRNEHATASVTVRVSDTIELMRKEYINTVATISADGEVLFAGILTKIDAVENYDDHHILNLELMSASIMLDQVMQYRSFQDVGLTYSDVFSAVIAPYNGAHYKLEKEDTSIGQPIIQYNETDWQFMKRLASHFSSSVIPIYETAISGLTVGLPIPRIYKIADLQDHEYDVTVSNQYFHTDEEKIGYRRSRISAVIITTMQNLDIGGKVLIANQYFRVYRKSAKLVDDVLMFTYTLSRADLLYSPKYYNQYLPGRSLTGRIIDVEKDMLKLHLSIDEKQEKSEAHWFRWAPISGNLFYLMPELGEYATLYFHNGMEDHAEVVSCVRNPAIRESGILAEPSKRQLQTKDHKKMFLYPNETGYISETSNTSIMLTDGQNIAFDSPKAVNILAGGKITVNSRKANYFTPTNLGLYAIGTGESIMSDAEPLASIDFSGPTVSMFSKYGKASLKFESGKNSGTPRTQTQTRPQVTDMELSKVQAGLTKMGSIGDSASQASAIETQKIANMVAATSAPMSEAGGGSAGAPSVGLTIGGTSSTAAALLPASLKPFQKGQTVGITKAAKQVFETNKLKSIKKDSGITVSPLGKSALNQVLKNSGSELKTVVEEKQFAPSASAEQVLSRLQRIKDAAPDYRVKSLADKDSLKVVEECGHAGTKVTNKFVQDVHMASVLKEKRASADITSFAEALVHRKQNI